MQNFIAAESIPSDNSPNEYTHREIVCEAHGYIDCEILAPPFNRKSFIVEKIAKYLLLQLSIEI